MSEFTNKVAIVTGGASGIGRAVCEALGRRGTVVVVADVNKQGAKQVAQGIVDAGGRAGDVHLDVTRAAKVEGLVKQVMDEHGRLDYMFNNAGVAVTGEVRDLALKHWEQVLDVNLMGVIYGATAAYKVMVQQGHGHIINTASLAGLIGYPTNIPYATSKYAVIGFSSSLRQEGVELGVKVSVICPGYVQSGIYEATPVVNAPQPKLSEIVEILPFKLMEADRAAEIILRGVSRNQEVIVFPFYARLLWWLRRIYPPLLNGLGRKIVADFRARRASSQGE